MNTLRTALLLAGLLALNGCKKEEAPVSPAPMPTAPTVMPQNVAAGPLRGKVVERLEVPNYTYLRLVGPTGETWAAVPTNSVPVGTEVTIASPMPMEHFESKTLNRTFDVIMFGSGAEVGGSAPSAADAPAAANPHAGGTGGTTAPAGAADLSNIKVARAEGGQGRTVAEVYGQMAALKDKTVAVRGKVVKVTSGVMGRNWLHVRDGSGTDAAQDNDLIVTTTDAAQLNDEVTLTGVVHTDKDLGSGYAYKVLIEDAKLTK